MAQPEPRRPFPGMRVALVALNCGKLILADNTLPDAVLDPTADSDTKRYSAAVAAHPALVSTIVPVLRRRGFDGLTVSVKRGPGG
ncbi:MAG: hypothetical protein DCC55_01220 [Chloroflexi bacterium]|nr:MAG: hypothetical protein DCC55_01220 [Chloroflexota bacterium]